MFDNLLFDNLILHNCGVTIVDYNSVEKVDDNSCRFSFFHHYPVNGGILINYVERFLVTDMNAINNVFAIYGNAGIEIDEDFPILMPLADGTFASGYEDTQGVAYFYFAEGHVPEDILVREA